MSADELATNDCRFLINDERVNHTSSLVKPLKTEVLTSPLSLLRSQMYNYTMNQKIVPKFSNYNIFLLTFNCFFP